MSRTAVGWLAWDLTHSTSWLGIVAFADLIPTVLFSVIAGAIADRIGLMRVMRVSQILATGVTTVFAALILADQIAIEAIVVLTLLFGTSEAMGSPARMSAVHAMVDRADLSAAIAVGSAAFNASRIVGPAIAGGLILWVGTGAVIAICAGMFLLFYLVLRTIRLAEVAQHQTLSVALFVDIWQGVVYAWRHPGIRFIMILLCATSFLVRPVVELMPGVSGQVFDAGPAGLSLLLSAIGAGAVAASLWLARRGEMAGLTALVTRATLMSGVALALAMAFDSIWLAAAFLAVMGAFMLAANVAAQSLVQNAVDARVRARVLSLFIVFAWGLPAVGAAIMGWIASFAGLQATLGGGAVFMVLVWLWARPRRKAIGAALERMDHGAGEAGPTKGGA